MSPHTATGPISQLRTMSTKSTRSALPLARRSFRLDPPGVRLDASKVGRAGVERDVSLKPTSHGMKYEEGAFSIFSFVSIGKSSHGIMCFLSINFWNPFIITLETSVCVPYFLHMFSNLFLAIWKLSVR